jgi:hypothetical protein
MASEVARAGAVMPPAGPLLAKLAGAGVLPQPAIAMTSASSPAPVIRLARARVTLRARLMLTS